MKTLDLNFYTDPAHGWLEVKRSHLIALGIEEQISRYSYEHGARVYLEEDNDMSRFMEAAAAAGWIIKTADFHNDAESFIRLLKGYQSTAASHQAINDFYNSNLNLTLADLSRFTGKPVKELKKILMEPQQ